MRYVIACCRPWCKEVVEDLDQQIEGEFYFIDEKTDLTLERLEHIDPQYVFFLHWSYIIPDEIYKRFECVIFHMTDVPYGRGGSPLQNLIARGHTTTKLTALRCVKELDAGPVYTQRDLSLSGSAQDIYLRAGKLSVEIIQWMIEEKPTPIPQIGEPVVFTRRIPEQSRLPESNDPVDIYDFIRMLDADGYPHAFIEYGDFRLEFRGAERDGGAVVAEVCFLSKIKKN